MEKKEKYAYWMHPSLVKKMEEAMDLVGVKSKSDYVSQAVEFFTGWLYAQRTADYLAPVLADVIKGEMRSVEKNISEMLFKTAVEQGIVSHILGAQIEVSDEELDKLRRLCAQNVAELNGLIRFEDAYHYQKGD